ncbi:hypothetical protein EB74_30020 [Mycobacterium sp. SWH-M5]|nr:hypothetical protein EB74_30020 [Mycobacterium sp. SWH-M5]
MRARTGYALMLRNVSMHFDLARWIRAMPVVCAVVFLVVCGGSYIFSLIRPAGVVGDSRIVMDRASGERYVNVNGRLHPVLNLSSARLIAGSYMAPTAVTAASIASFPKGPKVGIAGAPDEMAVTNGAGVSVAVCQRVPVNSVTGDVTVTVINGGLQVGPRARELGGDEAIVATLGGQTFIVWNGVKAMVDPADRIVLSALGIDRETVEAAMPLSGAVGNAIPSGVPMVVPVVPDAGAPAPWNLGASLSVGSVVQSDLPGQGTQFFVVLREGVQEISPVVAAMLRSQNAFGLATPPVVSPDALAEVPRVSIVQTSQYPSAPLRVVNAKDRPVTCWMWERGRTATSASAAVLTGTELPIAADADRAVSPVVSSHKGVDGADAVYMAPDAANYVAATGSSGTSSTRESMWWLSPSGTRFGLSADGRIRESLGLFGEPLSMPWSVLRLLPRGLPDNVALSKEDAMTQHDSLPSDRNPAALMPPA